MRTQQLGVLLRWCTMVAATAVLGGGAVSGCVGSCGGVEVTALGRPLDAGPDGGDTGPQGSDTGPGAPDARPDTGPDAACRDSTECADPLHVCRRDGGGQGRCALPQGVCQLDADCPDGHCDAFANVCVAGKACASDEECPAGQQCGWARGMCVPKPGQGCRRDTDCGPGEACDPREGLCFLPPALPCQEDAECPQGRSCDGRAGLCMLEAGPCDPDLADPGCPGAFSCNSVTLRCEPPPCDAQHPCRAPGTACNERSGRCEVPPRRCRQDADCAPPASVCNSRLSLCVDPLGAPGAVGGRRDGGEAAGCWRDGDCIVGLSCDRAGTCRRPPGSPCDNEGHCPAGSGCADGQCQERPAGWACAASVECAPGTVCKAGACTPGCAGSGDCPLGQRCGDEGCDDGCDSSFDAPAGSSCVGGRIVVGCAVDGDCHVGRLCDNRRCVDGCRNDMGCRRGQVCNEEACADGCARDVDCRDGFHCDGAQCAFGCRHDDGCSPGEICEGEQCKAGCRPGGQRGGHCPPGRVCKVGAAGALCDSGCVNDNDCPNGRCDRRAEECSDDECAHDGHCLGEEVCLAGACEAGCRVTAKCGRDEVCVKAPGQDVGRCDEGCEEGVPGHECDPGQVCRDGECAAGCPPEKAGESGARGGCEAGEKCVAGPDGAECEASPDCKDNRDCGPGKYCAGEGQGCQPGCWDQDQCDKGTYCNQETNQCEEGCRGTDYWFDCNVLRAEVCVGNECKTVGEVANELCERTPYKCCSDDGECDTGVDYHPFLRKCIPCGIPVLGRCKDAQAVCVRGFGDIFQGRCKTGPSCEAECNPNQEDHGAAECREECPESELGWECVGSRSGLAAKCVPRCCGEQDCGSGHSCVLCECKEGCRTEADCPPAGAAAPDGYECDKNLLEEINPFGLGSCIGKTPCACTQEDLNARNGEPGCPLGKLCDGCRCRDRCKVDEDCPPENDRCMNVVDGYGTCQAQCLEGCDDSVRDARGPCEVGRLCDGCHCVPGCTGEFACPEGSICGPAPAQGYAQCIQGCLDDSTCPRGRTCQNMDENGIGTCEMGACGRDCGEGRVCDPDRRVCGKACNTATDCDESPCRSVPAECVPGEGGLSVCRPKECATPEECQDLCRTGDGCGDNFCRSMITCRRASGVEVLVCQ